MVTVPCESNMSPVVNTLATNWLEISMPDANRVAGAGSAMLFHHVQMFVRSIKPLEEYKALEERLNSLANKGHFDPFSGGMRFLEVNAHQARVQEGKEIWEGTSGRANVHFDSAGQDIVEQLIVGLGWRITASVCACLCWACTNANMGAHLRPLRLDTFAESCAIPLFLCSIQDHARAPFS